MAPLSKMVMAGFLPLALGFTPLPAKTGLRLPVAHRMSIQEGEGDVAPPAEADAAAEPAVAAIEEAAPAEPEVSAPAPAPLSAAQKALPFLAGEPAYRGFGRDLAGDAAFDPLGFADTDAQLCAMREAEVKHARLAMLGAIGWPTAEKVHGGLATQLDLQNLLSAGGRAPSVLNGGLGNAIVAIGLGFAVILAGLIESGTLSSNKQLSWEEEKPLDYVAGDYGFDPVGFYKYWAKEAPEGSTQEYYAKKAMRTAELKNGRLAMVAITYFAIAEATSGKPMVELAKWAFQPFPQTVADVMGSAPALY